MTKRRIKPSMPGRCRPKWREVPTYGNIYILGIPRPPPGYTGITRSRICRRRSSAEIKNIWRNRKTQRFQRLSFFDIFVIKVKYIAMKMQISPFCRLFSIQKFVNAWNFQPHHEHDLILSRSWMLDVVGHLIALAQTVKRLQKLITFIRRVFNLARNDTLRFYSRFNFLVQIKRNGLPQSIWKRGTFPEVLHRWLHPFPQWMI